MLVLALREARSSVIHQKLLRNRFLLLLLGQTANSAIDASIVDNCANLEEFRQLVAIIGLVKVLREDLVSHLDGFQVHFELLSELLPWHVAPSLARIRLTLLFPLLLL